MDSSTLCKSRKSDGATKTNGAHTIKNNTTSTVDFAKDVFPVALFNKFGNKLIKKDMSSKRLVQLVLQYPEACIYMEACRSAHYLGR